MKISFKGDFKEIIEGAELLAPAMDFELGEGDKSVSVSRCDSGYSCTLRGSDAKIAYNTPADFFRALSIAVDAFKRGVDTEFAEAPDFTTLGIMLDVSRGAVIKPSQVKKIIGYIARMGYNTLMLYTEDVYEMEKYPYFGYLRGRYTKAELREIVSYAAKFGIETIPCIQTLGHLSYPLRWDAHGPMKEGDAVLYIGADETYELIDEMIKTMRECFITDKIHIGMDEAHGVGLGRYLLEHGYRNRFELLSEHLSRVVEIVKKYDFEPMMWSDMFFRLGSKINSYYDWDNELPNDIDKYIPDGMAQVYWDYYNHAEELYDIMFREHQKMKREIIFAGGVWIWSGPSVNNVQSVESTIPALRACKKYGVRQVYSTLWGDGGTECDVIESFWGLQMFAEYSYRGEAGMDTIDEMFRVSTGFDAELFKLFDIDDFGLPTYNPDKAPFEDIERHIINTSMQVLYLNPLMGLFDKNFEGVDLKGHYGKIMKELDGFEVPERISSLVNSHKQLVKVLYLKSDISPRIKSAYDRADKAALRALVSELEVLEREYTKHSELRLALWFENNKPFGYEPLMNRLAAARDTVHYAAERLSAYIDGKCERLEELEGERLWYNGIERPFFLEYFDSRIMMP